MLRGLDQLMERKEGGDMYLLWVPLIDDVRTLMMDEDHASRYLVNAETSKTFGFIVTAKDTRVEVEYYNYRLYYKVAKIK
ncbi:hypothetical protein Tco_1511181 [Tanacetum coccineum]